MTELFETSEEEIPKAPNSSRKAEIPGWRELFLDDRQRNEVEFCEIYAEKFNHGTDGHHKTTIIAKLAVLLDAIEKMELINIKEL